MIESETKREEARMNAPQMPVVKLFIPPFGELGAGAGENKSSEVEDDWGGRGGAGGLGAGAGG